MVCRACRGNDYFANGRGAGRSRVENKPGQDKRQGIGALSQEREEAATRQNQFEEGTEKPGREHSEHNTSARRARQSDPA